MINGKYFDHNSYPKKYQLETKKKAFFKIK